MTKESKMENKEKNGLTAKEEEVMRFLWQDGPMQVSKLVTLYPDPKPHFNTVSTVIRRMEAKGLVAHNNIGGSFEYYAVAQKEEYRKRTLRGMIADYFDNSYLNAVSTMVKEEVLTVDELKHLIEMIEKGSK